MKPKLQSVKTNALKHGRTLATGIALGALGGAYLVHRAYNPKDKIAIQFPKGVVPTMRETGKGVAINSNEGWFTIKYHPNE